MTFLLLGANGQVGRELRRALAPLGEVVCTTRSGTLEDLQHVVKTKKTELLFLALFLVQSHGTSRVAKFFGPIMVIWFLAIALRSG